MTGDDLPQRARASAPLSHGRGIPPGPAGQTRILYRVVDGYDGDTLTAKRTRSSKRPLSLGERIRFVLGAWALKDVLEGNGLDQKRAQDFTRPSSEVCSNFGAEIPAGIYGWALMSGVGTESGRRRIEPTET